MNPLDDPRVRVDQYIVVPSCYPLEEALALALKYVDKRVRMGRTAQEWVDHWAAERAAREA